MKYYIEIDVGGFNRYFISDYSKKELEISVQPYNRYKYVEDLFNMRHLAKKLIKTNEKKYQFHKFKINIIPVDNNRKISI